MQLVPLFFSFKERVVLLVCLMLLCCFTLGFKSYQFHTLKSQQTPQIKAEVLLQYTKTKNNKTYFVLKLKSDFGIFYTTTYEDLRTIKHRQVLLRIVLKNVGFLEFLKGFYAPSFNIVLLQDSTFKTALRQNILSQHSTQVMGEYYLALFLADSLPKQWRDLAQSYGIAHLFAISGFHIGILSAAGFFILGLLYKPLQARFFPFRNYFFDVGFIVVVLQLAYYSILTQSPSYLRAMTMSAVAFFMLWKGINIWRIEMLFWCVAILLALFPQLLFSVGFYFSCLGVLYIALFFKYFKSPKGALKKLLYGIALNASTFFQMSIIVHYFFPPFSPLVLLSLLFTPLFMLYYPFVLLAHLLGFGGVLDAPLVWWLEIPTRTIVLNPGIYAFLLCNALSLVAVKYKSAFLALLALNIMCFCYGVYLYFYAF
ncbi:ComEC/Rec2 family competence protein [Helicobacter sp.]|uniref:ComEC/Rec2 family competence protein n=1 Tax=Helicobacter sp. TaxID=218 RepID=UPI0025C38D3D|nr:ComEC/Rec2 family competence protein [Helicobacter sp.]MCI5969349.1 ComEC/Rec2 family competence protein [Helicobacter sp.]MDY2585603.1 ComEC/Rec2 family competence protein [Helicobacter sp.]